MERKESMYIHTQAWHSVEYIHTFIRWTEVDFVCRCMKQFLYVLIHGRFLKVCNKEFQNVRLMNVFCVLLIHKNVLYTYISICRLFVCKRCNPSEKKLSTGKILPSKILSTWVLQIPSRLISMLQRDGLDLYLP